MFKAEFITLPPPPLPPGCPPRGSKRHRLPSGHDAGFPSSVTFAASDSVHSPSPRPPVHFLLPPRPPVPAPLARGTTALILTVHPPHGQQRLTKSEIRSPLGWLPVAPRKQPAEPQPAFAAPVPDCSCPATACSSLSPGTHGPLVHARPCPGCPFLSFLGPSCASFPDPGSHTPPFLPQTVSHPAPRGTQSPCFTAISRRTVGLTRQTNHVKWGSAVVFCSVSNDTSGRPVLAGG